LLWSIFLGNSFRLFLTFIRFPVPFVTASVERIIIIHSVAWKCVYSIAQTNKKYYLYVYNIYLPITIHTIKSINVYYNLKVYRYLQSKESNTIECVTAGCKIYSRPDSLRSPVAGKLYPVVSIVTLQVKLTLSPSTTTSRWQ